MSVAFSADARTLITSGDDDTARLWTIPGTPLDGIDADRAAAMVCESVDVTIPAADWDRHFRGVDHRPPCPARR
ncbi:hypothetical protein BBK82_35825 [Lentzea guizhouensis]|uniref:Uncharacterized protein n=1 Tax=Lentzea guizhouensis TaxID=1586287 RepID=A0A1B2HS61_9PSEU|nr:hypothetical protein [Lentzea guizhouensis]ANZ40580.1 hypothetical protein BBK82_35825 [Lentzea guizhouensis]